MYKNKTIAVAFGGGGTCGLAHIGVIKAFEEYGIKPDYICGTSMGSIVGAFYACGHSYNDILRECEKLRFFKVFDLNPFVLTSTHLVPGKTTEKYLKKCTQERNFEDLKDIKFSCIATDLRKGEEFEFTSGPIWQGIRASISIPMIFKPVEHNSMLLVDGGLVNNVPAKNLKKYNPDIIIACDVLSEYVFYSEPKYWWDIIALSMNLSQLKGQKNNLNGFKYVIRPNTNITSPFTPSLKNINHLIEEGYKAAVKVIKRLNKNLDKIKK